MSASSSYAKIRACCLRLRSGRQAPTLNGSLDAALKRRSTYCVFAPGASAGNVVNVRSFMEPT